MDHAVKLLTERMAELETEMATNEDTRTRLASVLSETNARQAKARDAHRDINAAINRLIGAPQSHALPPSAPTYEGTLK